MNEVIGRTFRGERVPLDNVHYRNCTFERCVMVYTGTGPIGLFNNDLSDCSWTFEGAAGVTLQFLADFYKAHPQLIERIFENIRRGGRQSPSEPPPEFPDTIP